MRLLVAIFLFSFIVLAHAACQSAHRIISLAPNLTELVYTVGAGDALIARDESSDYPPAAKALPTVANYRDLDIEKIISLRPDLVLAWSGGNPKAQVDRLKQLGLNVHTFTMTKLLDIPLAMKTLGCLTGHEKQADQKAQAFLMAYQAEKKRAKTHQTVRVFFELSSQPLLTLTKNSLVNDMIKTCGGQNVFANTLGVAPEVSVEAVIHAKPEVMIGIEPGWESVWWRWPIIPAVQQKRMFTIDPDYTVRATDRSLMGLQLICHALQTS